MVTQRASWTPVERGARSLFHEESKTKERPAPSPRGFHSAALIGDTHSGQGRTSAANDVRKPPLLGRTIHARAGNPLLLRERPLDPATQEAPVMPVMGIVITPSPCLPNASAPFPIYYTLLSYISVRGCRGEFE